MNATRGAAMALLAALWLALPPQAPGVHAQAAARDVVVVVSASSSVTEIARVQLVDLYLGRTTRLPNGTPAVVFDQRPGTPDRVEFSTVFLGRSEAQVKAHWSKIIFTGRGRPPAEAANGEALRALVAADPNAIGYLERRLVNPSVRVVPVR